MNPKLLASITGAVIATGIAVFLVFSGTLTVGPDIQASGSLETADIAQAGTTVTDGVKHTVPLEHIVSGGPPPDGIPSIDNPKFIVADEADFVSDSDVVLGLNIHDDARAYPLFILVWHEIVNDRVGGVPVAVTYCPLCYTSQVFERTISGQEVEFGTSGKLYNSNLVMYDRLTGTYWSQALGTAIKGDLAGQHLEILPFDVIRWEDWKKMYPDSVVLTTDTGYQRPYEADPYSSYYADSRIMFPVKHDDDRMHPKEFILGFEYQGIYKAYKQDDVESLVVINDMVGKQAILLASSYDENSRAFDRMVNGKTLHFEHASEFLVDSTGSKWNYEGLAVSGDLEGQQLKRLAYSPGFWFEWVAFHPDTEVYVP